MSKAKKEVKKPVDVTDLVEYVIDIMDAVGIFNVIVKMLPSVIPAHKELRAQVCEEIIEVFPEAKEPGDRPKDKRKLNLNKRQLMVLAQGIHGLMASDKTDQDFYAILKKTAKTLKIWENYMLKNMIKPEQVEPYSEDLDGEELTLDEPVVPDERPA